MRNVLTLALKDAQLAGSTRDTLLSTAFFAGLLLMVLGIGLGSGLGAEAGNLRPAAAGAVWSALALAAAVAAGRAFAAEQEAGALETLTLYPGPHGGLYLGKLLGTVIDSLLSAEAAPDSASPSTISAISGARRPAGAPISRSALRCSTDRDALVRTRA